MRVLVHILCCLAAVSTQGMAATAGREDPTMTGHWRLQGDCRDHSGSGNDGVNHGAILGGDSALFDGRGAYIEVPDAQSLRLGTGDFTLAAWVRCAEGARVPGDIVTKYDPAQRRGVNLCAVASAPGYSSVSDHRSLLFGIDNAAEGEWIDCGRPQPDNPVVSTLIVHKGNPYTGTADAVDPKDACHVYRYAGGQEWIDCGRVTSDLKTPSIYSIIVHEGDLYVGTGAWDWERAWAGDTGRSRVCRYEGGTRWHDCGEFGDGYRVMSLASYRGDLYAADDKQMVFRYDGDSRWTPCGRIEAGSKLFAMMVYRDALWGASNTTIHRYDGESSWDIVGQFDADAINQIHTLGVHDGSLLAGTWPLGRVIRYRGDNDWADCGELGVSTDQYKINEVNELTTYNGKLYAGVIPKAEVWRYEVDGDWTLLRQLVANPEYRPDALPSWMRVPCMTVFGGKLYAGTSTCQGRTANANLATEAGKVFSWEAGKCVSYDGDLGAGWRHVVARRHEGKLRLYVDGKPEAESTEFDPARFDLTNGSPLRIGFGPGNYFSGEIRDVRLYSRALSDAEVAGESFM